MIEIQLRARVQRGDESAVNYSYDFLSLCSKLDPEMGDESKIRHLLRGLMSSIMQRVFLLLHQKVRFRNSLLEFRPSVNQI